MNINKDFYPTSLSMTRLMVDKLGENKILTKLPMRGKLINWKSIVGMELELLYRGEVYSVNIVKYENNRLWVDYNGYIYEKGICSSHFSKGKFGKILKFITNEFRCEVGKIILDNRRDMVITEREYRKRDRVRKKGVTYIENIKYYKCKCNVCGYDSLWIEESGLLGKKSTGCKVCNNTTGCTIQGINDIFTTNPEMLSEYGMDEKTSRTNSFGTHKRLKFICKDCGRERFVRPMNVKKNKSISCVCGNSFSYPEKFMYSFLRNLNVDFTMQLSRKHFKWCNSYRYDFYIPKYNMIIETHGIQHYNEKSKYSMFVMPLEKQQESDALKERLALKNGIENYVIIDCSKSELEYIKKSILNSKLNEFFELSQMRWQDCEKFALNNLAKEVCIHWSSKEDWETTKDVSKLFNLNEQTIKKYLKEGTKLNWCEYKSKKVGKSNEKQVEIFKNGVSLGIFESMLELERQSERLFGVKLLNNSISEVCREKRIYHKGYTFKYANKKGEKL